MSDQIDAYIRNIGPDKNESFVRILQCLRDNIPEGYVEQPSYGMIGFVVPLTRYPRGYRSDPSLPLPYISLGSQKHGISLYHMGLYADQEKHEWFVREYTGYGYGHKPDIGKSCIRFKYLNEIPYDLIARTAAMYSVDEWIRTYEQSLQDREGNRSGH